MHGFVASYFGHSEDTDPLSDAHLPHVDIVHFKMLKPTFVEIPTNLIRKVSKYWDTVKPKTIEKSLANSRFLLEKSNLIIGSKHCYLFFSLCSFLRKCLPNSQACISIVCLAIVISSKNGFS